MRSSKSSPPRRSMSRPMPKTGAPMSVRMTNCGALGWVSDKERGYRYEPRHPKTGDPWPAMPQRLLEFWNELAHYHKPPEACLVNVYDETARMGLHQDKDEADFAAPILLVAWRRLPVQAWRNAARRSRDRFRAVVR